MKLRDYQSRALDDLWAWFNGHNGGNPIVDACVGAGKSLMIAALAQRADAQHPGTRVLVLVHQKELLEQNVAKLLAVWPNADVGLYSASVGKKQLNRQLTYATIGSICNDAHKLGRIDIVLADECHLINPKDVGIWRGFLNDLALSNPQARVIGWTGTPFRGNWVWLTAGKEALFSHIASRVSMRELLDLGFLTPLVPAPVAARMDASAARIQNGDYVIADLERVALQGDLVRRTCAEIVNLAVNRKRWLVFAVSIEHANQVRNELESLGVDVDMVSAKTAKAEREEIIGHFRAGRIRCLVNVAVLTTGFDVPEVDFIALLRPTKSPVLYVQIAGRGMRCIGADINESIANGKADCMWADFTTTTLEMGPVDEIRGRNPKKKKKGGETPFVNCESCGSQNHPAARTCSSCGAVLREEEPERDPHTDEASNAAILSTQKENKIVAVPVSEVRYYKHNKPGSVPSLRVEYFSGLVRSASEWVCLSHTGYPRLKAETWWTRRSKIDAIPSNVDEAIEWLNFDQKILRTPVAITINKMGSYPTVVSHHWETEAAA
jgi:DNA repair protein RadD